MDGKRLIEKIRLRNILSFGDKGEEIELQPLNIIIGQNASGKSNLVDVIKLLRSLPEDNGLIKFISRNGGIAEWIWKGNKSNDAEIEINLHSLEQKIQYKIIFNDKNQRLNIKNEKIVDLIQKVSSERGGSPESDVSVLELKPLLAPSFNPTELLTVLIVLRSTLPHPVIYADLDTTRKAEMRRPQLPDAPNNFLEENANNLALVLNDLENKENTKDKIVENLKKFNPRIENYLVEYIGDFIQLSIIEENLKKPISAYRLSDGTLRYLCLLAILCHPKPPLLICIEEPETGLHPDILPTIAELMIEASQRTQLIVTTHSDILVSAFSEIPEAVLVCEKDEDGTHFKRLEADKLKVWLEEYTLGEVWMRGGIGGTRW